MQELICKIKKAIGERRRHSMWRRVVSVFMAVCVFITTYALILPAITATSSDVAEANGMTVYCDLDEHTHTDSCYSDVKYLCDPLLTADFVYHTHTDECYLDNDPENALVCNLEEVQGAHTHGGGVL